MSKKLKEIAEISSGYTFRESVKNDPNGDAYILQAKNISQKEDVVFLDDLMKIKSTNMQETHFLDYNNIIIVSRGSGFGSFRSSVFNIESSKVIPSSSLHVLEVRDVSVLPKYVSLYLNSEVGQKDLVQISTGGSYIRSLPIKNLMELKIPIPPIHIQKSIIALHENMQAQEKIQERKNELKKTIINAAFINLTL